MASLMTPLLRPQTPDEIKRAENRVAIWVSLVAHKLEQAYGQEWLEEHLRRALREGHLAISAKAVEAATRHDDELADRALRMVGAELQASLLQGAPLEPGHVQTISYLQRAAQRAPLRRKRGRQWYDHWVRDLGICLLIRLAALEFDVPITRNRASRRANRRPSAISLVIPALARRNRLHLEEGSVQEHIWRGLSGELSRRMVPTNELLDMLRAAVA